MAKIKNYSDLDGVTYELSGSVTCIPNAEFKARFPTLKGKRYDSFSMQMQADENHIDRPITRSIEYKSAPSKHKCDSRCMFAQGKTMRCECSCGGLNHGRGHFVCE